MGLYTEIGVVNRRDASADAIINEIREAMTKRHTALLADPPTDGDAKPEAHLRRRPVELAHAPAQPAARRVDARAGRTPRGRPPGGMDTAPARHTAEYLAESLGYVLGKKVGAPAGTSLVLDMEGSAPFAFEIDENGRGQRLPPPPDPTATLHMDRESFIRLAGGRCAAEPGKVTVDGDRELGQQVLDHLATTP